MDRNTALHELVDHIDLYLSRLTGEEGRDGIAEIRTRIAEARNGTLRPAKPGNATAVMQAHFKSALAEVSASGEPDLGRAIERASADLCWITYDGYDLDRIGPHFARGHAFATVIGDNAPLPAEDFSLGLFLIAPRVLYRDHHHPAPELYAPLTGPHGWRFSPGDPFEWRPAHQQVWNHANRPHATLTGSVPFFCVYGWTRDVNLVARTIPSDDWLAIDSALVSGKA